MEESCSFQSQLLSVMEVLAKAAVAEINRRVDDSCAVLRLEVSQSRRDIDLLKGKCEVMEAELRRSRVRARRKGEEDGHVSCSCPAVCLLLTCVSSSFFFSVLSSCSREILSFSQSGAEQRQTDRLGQTDGRRGSKSTPAGLNTTQHNVTAHYSATS